jgi:hypothetical protein
MGKNKKKFCKEIVLKVLVNNLRVKATFKIGTKLRIYYNFWIKTKIVFIVILIIVFELNI